MALKPLRVKWNHIALAPKDAEKLKKIFQLLQLYHAGAEEVSTQKVKTDFWETLPSTPQLEILTSTAEDGAVSQFLKKKGGGIHHLCFEVQGLDEVCEYLKGHGVRLTHEKPQLGAHDMKIVFIHPESTGGILIELSEPAIKESL